MVKEEDTTPSAMWLLEELGPAHRSCLGFPFSMDEAWDDGPVQERQVLPEDKIPDLNPS